MLRPFLLLGGVAIIPILRVVLSSLCPYSLVLAPSPSFPLLLLSVTKFEVVRSHNAARMISPTMTRVKMDTHLACSSILSHSLGASRLLGGYILKNGSCSE